MRIELVTKDGQHVAWVEIPPFQTMPDIVAWGDRTFTLDLKNSRTLRQVEALLLPPEPKP